MKTALVFLVSSFIAVSAGAAPVSPWATHLTYDGGGYWRTRLPVFITNSGTQEFAGIPVVLAVKADAPTRVLIGKTAAELRAVNDTGAELLLGLETPNGEPKRTGVIAAGDKIILPAEVAPGKTERLTLYAANPEAWNPPEWFGAVSLTNGGFENGGKSLSNWTPRTVDATHRMLWQKGDAHGGLRCARCEVDAGALPTWIQYRQDGIRVLPGTRYRLTAWVKGRNVQGQAGWYVHVDGKRPQMVNKVEAWDGSFDWRKATIEFQVPDGGETFSCGTLLHGTGVAWFDDVRLEKLADNTSPGVRVGKAEVLRLKPATAARAWTAPPGWAWRAPLVVRNFSDAPFHQGAISVDMRPAFNQIVKQVGFDASPSFRLVNPFQPDQPLAFEGNPSADIRFAASLPPKSVKIFYFYVNAAAHAPGQSPRQASFNLAGSAANRVENGLMEKGTGEKAVGWNTGEEGRPGQKRFHARRIAGGRRGGKWQLELQVPAAIEKPGWCGWRQKVRIKPGTRYLLSGDIRCKAADEPVTIHGHFLRADGSLTERPFFSAAPRIKGNADWTRTSASVVTPADCAFLEIHLTMNCHGTVWHDNVSLVEILPGHTGKFTARTPQKAPLAAWSVNPLVKVFREDLPPKKMSTAVRVYSARNAWRAGKIAVRSREKCELRIRVTDLRQAGGATIPPPDIYRVGYVPVDFPIGYDSTTEPVWHRHFPRRRGNDGWTGWWPDPLVPVAANEGLQLAGGRTQGLVLDCHVPADARPGTYAGTVVLTSANATVHVPVQVRVWSLQQPAERRLPALYDLRNGRGTRAFGTADTPTARDWYRFLARYNVSPSFDLDQPKFQWKNGTVQMDATAFDDTATYLFDELHVPKVYTPRFFYACGWAYPPKKIFGLEPFTPEYVTAWKQAYRLFIDHITAKGWRSRFVFYISDEPHEGSEVTIQGLARISDMAREIAPDVPIYSSTWRYIDGLSGHISLWGIGPQGSFDPDKLAERRKAGDHFWYTTDGQMCLDTPYLGIEYLLPWFCLKYGCEAYEFWGVSWWTYDPWKRGWHTYISQSSDGKEFRWVRYPNGDGFLTYPGENVGHAGPLPSIRLVAAREGVDDYEILLRLARLAMKGNAQASAVLENVRKLVNSPNPGGRYSSAVMPDPGAVHRTAIRAGEILEAAENNR